MSRETEAIKERLNIADVVSEYVKLKQAGQSMKGLCPFHQEKTPSFIVTPRKGSWHCFGCQKGGDVITFIQEIEGLEFPAALKLLADRAGVQLPDYKPQVENRRQRLYDLLATTTRLYHEILMNQKAGAQAKEYLVGRGLTEKTMEEFTVGYAPHSWDTLSMWLKKKGYTEEEMVAAGMVGMKDKGGTFDRFRGRIMFPVSDTQGRVVAFGGRIVPWHETGNEGKYVNSPETALYEKRRTVYNLSRAKRHLKNSTPCIVVEGYMDVVMLVQAGVENVVATSGTAMTDDHVALIGRFTNVLHLAFDGDAAGWKATIAATSAALAGGMRVETIVFSDGIDPADLVKDTPDAVQGALAATRPLVDVLVERIGAGSPQQREQALAALLPLLRIVRNPIEQGAMVDRVSRLLKIPDRQIVELMQKESAPPAIVRAAAPVQEEAFEDPREAMLERQLLGVLLAHPEMLASDAASLSSDLFLDPMCRQVYNEIQRTQQSSQSLPEQYQSFLVALQARAEELAATSSFSQQEEVRTMVRALHRRYIRSQLHRLAQEGSPGALVEFQIELTKLAEIDA
ncbi:MAG: DNA primase [Candidatus Andersenbacteria bacterium RIFCSPHIGHO2_12_FULL_45_11]|uniref:DNA primase n=1 Tax=Candidatus Andersenbacteria bacterium RIFCSPHIGHO2_12_FULL_45_11 TaxID=1797281 RepID=A0A1G1X5F9_9BACT|nr:MAG: DNA primase [Candidatus Andersenbacteria bacterium RIFCSPHIGHO2_12_FULL_45_11]